MPAMENERKQRHIGDIFPQSRNPVVSLLPPLPYNKAIETSSHSAIQ
jgi:hypothetical protein